MVMELNIQRLRAIVLSPGGLAEWCLSASVEDSFIFTAEEALLLQQRIAPLPQLLHVFGLGDGEGDSPIIRTLDGCGFTIDDLYTMAVEGGAGDFMDLTQFLVVECGLLPSAAQQVEAAVLRMPTSEAWLADAIIRWSRLHLGRTMRGDAAALLVRMSGGVARASRLTASTNSSHCSVGSSPRCRLRQNWQKPWRQKSA